MCIRDRSTWENLGFSSHIILMLETSDAFMFKVGCLNGLLATILGAMGGHKNEWQQNRNDIWRTAQLYQFISTFGMIVNSFRPSSSYPFTFFCLSVLLFALPLYYRAWTEQKTFSILAPFGGISMMLAWLFLFLL
eukprot:TRINITY_DN846_c0_g1_i9.p2 TRINITY_DN846_c0_g1~~TRINITY_DN846_c0_g1_i9.p2  ORF type:complete len:135 (+),score=5.73 TRINITY_DN846_c0_g1_i9:64-468(+)